MKRAGLLLLTLALAGPAAGSGPPDPLASERNLGVAEFQNEEYARAATHFERAVSLSPKTVEDRINQGLSLLQARDLERAITALGEARKLSPASPHAAYLLAIAYGRQGKYAEARDEFEKLLRLDPLCAPAEYNLGVALKRLDLMKEATVQWEKAVQLDLNHGPAYFQLFNHFREQGNTGKAERAFVEFTRTKEKGLGPGSGIEDVERSRYLEVLTYPGAPEKNRGDEVKVKFKDATRSFGLSAVMGAPAAVLADMDGDGDIDLVLGNRVYRNDRGTFSAAPPGADPEQGNDVSCIATWDFNGDAKLDLVLCAGARLLIHAGNGDLSFRDVTSQTGVERACGDGMAPIRAQPADFDHEGDLDLVVSCAGVKNADKGKIVLLRNNGNDTFTDVTETSGVNRTAVAPVEILLSDFDSRNDIDLLFPAAGGGHHLFLNRRDGTFRNFTSDSGLSAVGTVRSILAADLNADGPADLAVVDGTGTALVFFGGGDGSFHPDLGSPILGQVSRALNVQAAALIDVDNDGDLDLILAGTSGSGLGLLKNDHGGGWADAGGEAFGSLRDLRHVQKILGGDLDGDGDPDLLLVAPGKPLTVLRNEGGNANRALHIRLSGRKNNTDGFGSKMWVKDGRFYVFREVFDRWTDIGVGKRKSAEVVGLRWPTGVEQNELNVKTSKRRTLEIAERPGIAESCPFLYVFDGERFRFVTDFLDTTPLGIQLAPGVPFHPNDREAVRIDGDWLKPANGVLSLRITQELQEITYVDRLRLFVVDHPKGSVIVPNDRFSEKPFAPFKIHVIASPLPPAKATDEAGRDVRSALLEADRVYAYDTPPEARKYPGITNRRSLILDPGPAGGTPPAMLFLRGTTLWTDASVNFAVAQNPNVKMEPVSLDVIGRDGNWKRAREDLGLPAGIDKFLPVDLKEVFETGDYRVRISTNLAILWDQAFFSAAEPPSPDHQAVTSPSRAELRYRGYSTPYSPDGRLPDLYEYERILPVAPFRPAHGGSYTPYGGVSELLREVDDRFVILAPGDDLAVEFPAADTPPPIGWVRDYILDVDGWIKDNDLRTATGETVKPLPFHSMSRYPDATSGGGHGDRITAQTREIYPRDAYDRR